MTLWFYFYFLSSKFYWTFSIMWIYNEHKNWNVGNDLIKGNIYEISFLLVESAKLMLKSKHKKPKFQTAHIKKLNVMDWTNIKPSMIGIEYLNLSVRDTHFWENKCVIIKVFTDLWVLNGQGGDLFSIPFFPFFDQLLSSLLLLNYPFMPSIPTFLPSLSPTQFIMF